MERRRRGFPVCGRKGRCFFAFVWEMAQIVEDRNWTLLNRFLLQCFWKEPLRLRDAAPTAVCYGERAGGVTSAAVYHRIAGEV